MLGSAIGICDDAVGPVGRERLPGRVVGGWRGVG